MHRNREDLSSLSKIDQFLVLILIKWRPSWILLAMQYLKYAPHLYVRHALKPYDTHQNYDFVSILYKMMPIYCLTLHK